MEINKRERSNIIIFDIIGDFQRPKVSTGTLLNLVKEQLNEGKRNFLINLENIDNIDDVGIGEMMASLVFVTNFGGKLKFIPLKFWHDRNLEIGCHIWTYKNEDEAIKSFSE